MLINEVPHSITQKPARKPQNTGFLSKKPLPINTPIILVSSLLVYIKNNEKF
jgi:hypothetical protein